MSTQAGRDMALSDEAFFEMHPHRSYRLRPSYPSEWDADLYGGQPERWTAVHIDFEGLHLQPVNGPFTFSPELSEIEQYAQVVWCELWRLKIEEAERKIAQSELFEIPNGSRYLH